MTARAVILARGLGTRMREEDRAAPLTPSQAEAAAAGHKALMPIHGRPFLDYLLSAIADAGVSRVALVVAPDHDRLRQRYAESPPSRVTIDFAVQEDALGTAHAIAGVEAWASGEPFLAMNGDNLYPVPALRDLASLDEPGLPAFERDELVASGNIPAERVGSFAVLDIDGDGYLRGIVEKPGELPPEGGSHGDLTPVTSAGTPVTSAGTRVASAGTRVASAFRRKDGRKALWISMNCWRFDSRIFAACRDVPRSARGEFELPEAVGLAVTRGVRFKAVPARGPVLDLSRRADAAEVERRLAGTVPRP